MVLHLSQAGWAGPPARGRVRPVEHAALPGGGGDRWPLLRVGSSIPRACGRAVVRAAARSVWRAAAPALLAAPAPGRGGYRARTPGQAARAGPAPGGRR